MKTTQVIVACVALFLAIVATALISCDNVEECERDGHSWSYCYQLLYGKR